ncbi:MAG: SRPBCC domain-containing protein [Pseudomonadota bacterium]
MTQAQAKAPPDERPDFVLETIIHTKPERVWNALTESSHVKLYHFAHCSVKASLKPGGRLDHHYPNGELMLGGEIIALDPPRRLEMTFEPAFFGPDAPASRCVYELEAEGDCTRFRVLHFGIAEGQTGVIPGWASVSERLKVYLEHGSVDSIVAREAAMREAAA